MANTISYNMIAAENLNRKPLKVEQMEVVLEISGVNPDPLTLQQIRDEPSIRDVYRDRSARINNMIKSAAEQAGKAKTTKEAEAIVASLNKQLQTIANTLQKDLQTRVNAFSEKQKQQVNDLFWARARIIVKVAYAVAKLVKSAGEAVAAVTAGVASMGFLTVVAVKQLIAAAQDAYGVVSEIASACESERAQWAKLDAAIKELKKFKQGQPVPQSKISAVEALIGPYSARLLGVDEAAKNAASTLDAYLKKLDAGKFHNQAAQAAVERATAQTIEAIIKMSGIIAQGRKTLQSAKDKIKEASKRAQKEPTSWWDYAPALWKAFDYFIDGASAAKAEEGVVNMMKAVWKTVQEKLQDELKDAQVEAVTA